MSLALFFSQSKARVGWEILGFSDFGLFQSDKILGKKMKMAWLASVSKDRKQNTGKERKRKENNEKLNTVTLGSV